MEQPTRVSKLSPVSWINKEIVCVRVRTYVGSLELPEMREMSHQQSTAGGAEFNPSITGFLTGFPQSWETRWNQSNRGTL